MPENIEQLQNNIRIIVFFFSIAFLILRFIGMYGMFKRAKIKKLHRAFIPYYNEYILSKIVGKQKFGKIHFLLLCIMTVYIITLIGYYGWNENEGNLIIITHIIPTPLIIGIIILILMLITDLILKTIIYTGVCELWSEPKHNIILFLIIPDFMYYIYGYEPNHRILNKNMLNTEI